MRPRGIVVSVATVGLMVGPAFGHGVMGGVAGAKAECTITGTAADDTLTGTTRGDVICAKAGSDTVDGLEGNDVIRGGQGDDGGGVFPCPVRRTSPRGICNGVMHAASALGLNGGDGSDVVKGQADDDSMQGSGQNDRLYGGQGNDCLGLNCTTGSPFETEQGNDFLKSKDNVSGNDYANGGDNTDTCRIDAGDAVFSCEL